jgi:hypothetical protein
MRHKKRRCFFCVQFIFHLDYKKENIYLHRWLVIKNVSSTYNSAFTIYAFLISRFDSDKKVCESSNRRFLVMTGY